MEKILIVGPAWVGDMVMAQSLFRVLKQRYSAASLDVLAPPWSEALLARMPEVNQAISLSLGHGELGLKIRYDIAKRLRKSGYQRAYVLPNSWKSALIPFWARIPQRLGWRGECRWGLLNDCRPLSKVNFPYMVQRFVALAYASETSKAGLPLASIPKPKLITETASVDQTLLKFSLNLNQPVLALCPGAEFGPSKQWPASHYAELALQRLKAGWSVWVFGSVKDRPVAMAIRDRIQAQAPTLVDQIQVLAGDTQLGQAIDLLSASTAVVSNDSGLMHVAAALDKPLVALYGSTDPGFTPPLSERTQVLRLKLDCSPCFKRSCPLQHHRCLQDLKPGLVNEALDALRESPCPQH